MHGVAGEMVDAAPGRVERDAGSGGHGQDDDGGGHRRRAGNEIHVSSFVVATRRRSAAVRRGPHRAATPCRWTCASRG